MRLRLRRSVRAPTSCCRRFAGSPAGDGGAQLIRRYEFAVPTDDALDAIGRWSPRGVVEIGAGLGYWAHLLADREVDVAAFDLEPPPSAANRWFRGVAPWHPVQRADHRIVQRFGVRTPDDLAAA